MSDWEIERAERYEDERAATPEPSEVAETTAGEREVEALAKVLIEEGAGVGSSIHGWRCEYPDRYGPCDCVDETARAILDSPALAALLDRERREAKVEALRIEADLIGRGTCCPECDGVADMLRDRADQIEAAR